MKWPEIFLRSDSWRYIKSKTPLGRRVLSDYRLSTKMRLLNSKIEIDFPQQVKKVIKNITAHHEEAFYLCNINDIIEKHKRWMHHLPDIQTYYAVKCNDDLPVLQLLAALGTCFDCASQGEIRKVLSVGVAPDRILYANPTKPVTQIKYAGSVGVDTMTFDNENELHKIHKYFPEARLVLRIRSDATDARYPMGMKFGCDPTREAPKLLRVARDLGLNITGVSFHVGSGCQEPAAYGRAIRDARAVFDQSRSLGFDFTLLDIGGGYPGEKGTSLEQIAGIVKSALNNHFSDLKPRVIAEPGAFYVASAYSVITCIHSIRNIVDEANIERQRMYYINDGVFGSFNCVVTTHDTVYGKPLDEYPGSGLIQSSVWGPTCDGLDKVVSEELLPDMQIGDWMVFDNMGAYSLPLATSFNGYPIPEVYYVMSREVRKATEDLLSIPFKYLRIVDDDKQI